MDEAAAGPPGEARTDEKDAIYTDALGQADVMANLAAAMRLQVMLAGFEGMLLDEAERCGAVPSEDSPAVKAFFMHQGFVLHVSRHAARARVGTAAALRDRLPATWAVLLAGAASEQAVTVAAAQAEGLAARHLPAFDAAASGLVAAETAAVVERRLAKLRDELDPAAAATRHRTASDRRHLRARMEGDGQGSLTITGPALDIAAVYDRIRRRAVTAHGRAGECRTLGQLMFDTAVDDHLDASGAVDEDGIPDPSFPAERAGSDAAQDRKRIDATVLVIVPAATATGAGNQPAEVAGMGTIDAETARNLVAHTRTWTRVLVDPVDDAILGFDSHERCIPAALRKMIHFRMPTCAGDGCGLPAHRCDVDHMTRVEHDERTRHTNLHPLCRASHQAKDGGYLDVRPGPDGVPVWKTAWGATRRATSAFTVRARPALPDEPPF